MNHYVYYSYEPWGKGYIGRRSCKCDPSLDTSYFGTFKDKSFRPTEKIILATTDSYEQVCEWEVQLHNFYEVDTNPHFANKAKQTSVGFSFRAAGEENPNYGGGKKSEEGIQKIRETVKKTMERHGNPFAKKGEESQSHGRVWVTNSDRSEEIYLKKGEEIPNGWERGRKKRPPRSQESRNRTSLALKGKKKSEEHKRNLSIATSNFYKNQKNNARTTS
jgi:hypothetical protein